MEIIFTKGPGKFDLMEVLRPEKPLERVECPKQRIIPHDMVHYAVEHTLYVKGFLGRVTCYARSSQPLPVDEASVDVVRAAIAELTRQWDVIPIGGSLKLAL
jgi:hypothetical protein